MDDAKTRRLAERIAKIVAELLERRIKDPRLGFVTVTEARLTERPARGEGLLHGVRHARGAATTRPPRSRARPASSAPRSAG